MCEVAPGSQKSSSSYDQQKGVRASSVVRWPRNGTFRGKIRKVKSLDAACLSPGMREVVPGGSTVLCRVCAS